LLNTEEENSYLGMQWEIPFHKLCRSIAW